MDLMKLVWVCGNCTYENDQYSFLCDVCEAPKPARVPFTNPQQISAVSSIELPSAQPEAPIQPVQEKTVRMVVSRGIEPLPQDAVVEDVVDETYCSNASCFLQNPCPIHGVQVGKAVNETEAAKKAKEYEKECRERQAKRVIQEAERAKQQKALAEREKADREKIERAQKAERYAREQDNLKRQQTSSSSKISTQSSPASSSSSSSPSRFSPSPSSCNSPTQQTRSMSSSPPSSSSSPSSSSPSSSSPSSSSCAASQEPPKANPEWKCKWCTLDNPMDQLVCGACEQICSDPVSLSHIKATLMRGSQDQEDNCNCEPCELRRAKGIAPNPLARILQGYQAAANAAAVDRLNDLLRVAQGGSLASMLGAGGNMYSPATHPSSLPSHQLLSPPRTKVPKISEIDEADLTWRKGLVAEQYVDACHTNGHFYLAYVVAVQADDISLRFVEIEGELIVNRYSTKLAVAGSKTDNLDDEGDELVPEAESVAEAQSSTTSADDINAGLTMLQLSDGRKVLMSNAFMDMFGASAREEEVADLSAEALSKEERAWREGLKVGDFLDALDTAQQWYIAEIIDEEKGGQFKITFTEWQSTWDTWISRWSPRIAEPKTKSKTRAEQDPDTIRIRKALPDYSQIDMAPTACCITKQSAPLHVGKGRMILSKMPGDNSCLFHAIGFVCGGQASPFVGGQEMMRNRLRCAEAIAQDPIKYTPAILGGCTNLRYSDKLKTMQEWGGAIELQILSDFFKVEIISFDVVGSPAHGPMVYKFPASGHSYTKRVFLVYRDNHYDALVFLHRAQRQPQLQEFFASTDLHAVKLARRHVEMIHLALHRKGYVTMKWRGLNEEEMSPILNRSASQTLGDEDAVVSPRLKRAQSEKGNY